MPTFVGLPPDPDTLPVENPPGPDPDPPPVLGGGTTYYLDSGGSDSDDGSEASPWATLAHAISVLTAGQNLIVEDGSYTGSGNKQITWASATGTSGAPITIAARNRGLAVFNGQANGTSDNGVYWLSVNGAFNFITFDGLKLTNFSMTQNGIVTISNQNSGGSITGWTFRNMDIQEVAHSTPNPDASSQILYLGERFHDLLSENNIYRGPYPGSSVIQGAAISAYADTGPGPTGIISRGDQYIGCYIGYQLYHVDTNGECSDGIFTDCQTNIDLTRHAAVLVTGNTGDHGAGADIYDPTYSAFTTSSGNVFT